MSNRIVFVPEPRRPLPLRRCSFRFPGERVSVQQARDWLERRLKIVGVPEEVSDTALLLLSELATNQVLHAPAPGHDKDRGDYFVRVFFFPDRLRVEVQDVAGRAFEFHVPAPDSDSEHGRGLFLVNALASRWGRFESGRGPGMFFELHWGR